MIVFQNWYLVFLILPLILLLFIKKRVKTIKYPSVILVKKSIGKRNIFSKIGKLLFFLSLIFFIIALMRPQFIKNHQKSQTNGIDIVISLDVSESMLNRDFLPNRLEASKNVIKNFITQRKNDRIGLVIFSGTAFTKIPLTTDYGAIDQVINTVSYTDVSAQGTAVGMGVAVAANRLKNSTAKSKIIILITDGTNNTGAISPEAAGKLAMDLGIKVYTIGIGSKMVKERDFFGNEQEIPNPDAPDEELLKKIAKETNGEYFNATDSQMYNNIFNKIDSLEKSKIESKKLSEKIELYHKFVIIGIVLLLLSLLFDRIIFVRVP